jgi:hypothetical protein
VQASKENLLREHRHLKRRFELLSTQVEAINKRRSVSECSVSTVSSSHSSNSESGKATSFFNVKQFYSHDLKPLFVISFGVRLVQQVFFQSALQCIFNGRFLSPTDQFCGTLTL